MTDDLTPDDLAQIEARAETAAEAWYREPTPDPYPVVESAKDVPRLVRALWDAREERDGAVVRASRADRRARHAEAERDQAKVAEKQVRKARLCEKHYWDVDDEVYRRDGCTLCYMNRAEKAEARVNELDRTLEATIDERDRLRARLEAVQALAERYDETDRYGGQPWGDVPVWELRAVLDAS
jgi:hypothetical protein